MSDKEKIEAETAFWIVLTVLCCAYVAERWAA